MTFLLANGYIPLAPIAPASQAVLLVVIIAFEAWFIARMNRIRMSNGCFWRLAVVNVVTSIIGIGILIPTSMFEAWILFGWGSNYVLQPTLWWIGIWIYGIILPFSVWIICYHISWRVEYFILKGWTSDAFPEPSRLSLVYAHRWTYGFLGLLVVAGCVSYFYMFITTR